MPLQVHALEQALCHKMIECGCGESFSALGLQPPLDCHGWTLESLIGADPPYYYGYGYEGGYDDEEPLPISLDEDCIERMAQELESEDCDSFGIRWSCEVACLPYFGPRLEGQTCDGAYDCGRGLYCVQGECRDPCSVASVGEGERCDGADCRSGLRCEFEPSLDFPVCVRPPGLGAPCGGSGDCSGDTWCDPTSGTCAQQRSNGAACQGHQQCESVYCPAGFCAVRPGPHMPCGISGICADDAICIADENGEEGTCVPAPPLCEGMLDLLDGVIDAP